MANLSDYFADGTKSGSKETIWAQELFYFKIGSGEVTDFEDKIVKVYGKIDFAGYTGDFHLGLELHTDENCSIDLNGIKDDEAHYEVKDDTLIVCFEIQGKDATVRIHKIDGGKQTEIIPNGTPADHNIHLVPA